MTAAEFVYTVLLKAPPLRRAANALLRSFVPATIQVRGATIHLNPSDPVVSGALTLRCYENQEIAFFARHFQPGMTFVDVGANIGLYTGLALALVGANTRILAVEPDRESCQYLHHTIESNGGALETGSVVVRQLAASDSTGELTLYKNSRNRGDNRIYADPLCDGRETVQSDTLDNLCREAGIESIDFLKVDVQGADHKVLSGAAGILSRSPRCTLMAEFWPRGLICCGSSPAAHLALLGELGFSLHELVGSGLSKIRDSQKLIDRTRGRVYRSLIGFKGNPGR